MQQLLLDGSLAQALDAAMNGGLWGLALILGKHLGPEAFAEAAARMVAASLAPNTPLHTAAMVLAGKADSITGGEEMSAKSHSEQLQQPAGVCLSFPTLPSALWAIKTPSWLLRALVVLPGLFRCCAGHTQSMC